MSPHGSTPRYGRREPYPWSPVRARPRKLSPVFWTVLLQQFVLCLGSDGKTNVEKTSNSQHWHLETNSHKLLLNVNEVCKFTAITERKPLIKWNWTLWISVKLDSMRNTNGDCWMVGWLERRKFCWRGTGFTASELMEIKQLAVNWKKTYTLKWANMKTTIEMWWFKAEDYWTPSVTTLFHIQNTFCAMTGINLFWNHVTP